MLLVSNYTNIWGHNYTLSAVVCDIAHGSVRQCVCTRQCAAVCGSAWQWQWVAVYDSALYIFIHTVAHNIILLV
jgi:hypothetical protein